MGLIDTCFSKTKLGFKDIDRIGVTIGPGSFTGVRVGMSVARGFGLSLDLPVIGVSTLDACEAEVTSYEGELVSLLDAKRGELYCQIKGENPFASSYEELEELFCNRQISACGAGAEILNHTTNLELPILHKFSAPKITTVAKLASAVPEQKAPPEPLYLRSADAKVQAGFALERV